MIEFASKEPLRHRIPRDYSEFWNLRVQDYEMIKRCLPELSHEQLGPTFPIISRMASSTAIAATKTIRHIKTTRITPSFLLRLCLACLCEGFKVRFSLKSFDPGPTLSYTTSGPFCCLGFTVLLVFLCSVLYGLFDPASSYNLFSITFKLVLLLRFARSFELTERVGLRKPFSYWRAIWERTKNWRNNSKVSICFGFKTPLWERKVTRLVQLQ